MENKKLQERVLGRLRDTQKPALFILRNGYRFDATVLDFDDSVIVVDSSFCKQSERFERQRMVCMSAISTIAPHDGVI